MKKFKNFLYIFFPVLVILVFGFYFFNISPESSGSSNNDETFDVLKTTKVKKSQELRGSPGFQKEYFGKTHYPQSSDLGQEQILQMWDEIEKMPNEKDFNTNIVPWRPLGPNGSAIDSTGVRKYTGRVLDLKITNGNLKVASASGGLWASNGSDPIPMTDNLSSLAIGSFAINPGDSNIIIVGTGEPNVLAGTGLHRSTNGGLNWTRISMGNTPRGFFRIMYAPNSQTVLHAATTNGYYRSDNNGLNWTRYFEAEVSDVIVNPLDPNIAHIGVWDKGTGKGGIYKSTNAGTNWTKLTTQGLPTSNVGRVSLALCKNVPNNIWALIGKNDNNFLLGVYKTASDGVLWTSVSPTQGGDILGGGFGWYVHAIGVSATNPQVALVGGIWLYHTTNGGVNWFQHTDITTAKNLHADQHEVLWGANGQDVWVANDGGVSYSNDGGESFTTQDNFYPITQYANFDVAPSNRDYIFGGSRDNAITGTTNGGNTWIYAYPSAADGGGIAFDPFNNIILYATLGNYGGALAFHRIRTMDFGKTWIDVSSGIGASREEYPKIRAIPTSPTTLFTNSWTGLYKTENFGMNWTLYDAALPFKVYDFSIGHYPSEGKTIVYVWLESAENGKRLYISTNNGPFVERSTGLEPGLWVKSVIPHPTNPTYAYALMTGTEAGKKIYKTKNLGLTWTNITGNLPNVVMSHLVTHPKTVNNLYLGTEMGCYKSTNHGFNWFRWNEGMPEAAIVTEMKPVMTDMNEFFIYTSTYGRGIFRREEPPQNNPGEETMFQLFQNYPNPFNPVTQITFTLPVESKVTLKVYDVTGRLVTTLVNETRLSGLYTEDFNGANLSSGVYFLTIQAGDFKDTKRMMLIK
ncbi:MAG TPA: hypothetical protein DEP28_05235 [Bacteroidetes bacterium]|nr:hypothetical protein [Bacteroidota bacterium]HCN37915.1 hypothetical protein [Bacteroidota bacterium]